jgi:hypothetical protein
LVKLEVLRVDHPGPLRPHRLLEWAYRRQEAGGDTQHHAARQHRLEAGLPPNTVVLGRE